MKKRDAQNLTVAADANKERNLHPHEGSWYAFVTVGPVYYGQLVAWDEGHYHLKEASWVVETGRLHQFVQDPSVATEVEYVGEVIVERSAVMGFYPIAKGGKLNTR